MTKTTSNPALIVETRYVGATDRRGSRIVATFAHNHKARVSVSYESGVDPAANHEAAAVACVAKFGGDLFPAVTGTPMYRSDNGRGWHFVFAWL